MSAPNRSEIQLLLAAAPVAREKPQDIQEQVDKVEIQLQSRENRSLLEDHGISHPAVILIILSDLGSIISSVAEEDRNAQVADHNVESSHIHEHSQNTYNDQHDETAKEQRTNRIKFHLEDQACRCHSSEEDSRCRKCVNQDREIKDQEIHRECKTCQRCVDKKQRSCRAHAHLMDTRAQENDNAEFSDRNKYEGESAACHEYSDNGT